VNEPKPDFVFSEVLGDALEGILGFSSSFFMA